MALPRPEADQEAGLPVEEASVEEASAEAGPPAGELPDRGNRIRLAIRRRQREVSDHSQLTTLTLPRPSDPPAGRFSPFSEDLATPAQDNR
jgi:hypothetical protein